MNTLLPVGRILGLEETEKGPGVLVESVSGVTKHDPQLADAFNLLKSCPTLEEFEAGLGEDAVVVIDYFQRHGLFVNIGQEDGKVALLEMAAVTEVGVESYQEETGTVSCLAEDGSVFQVNALTLSVVLGSGRRFSLWDSAKAVAKEAELGPEELLAVVAEELPVMIKAGVLYLQRLDG